MAPGPAYFHERPLDHVVAGGADGETSKPRLSSMSQQLLIIAGLPQIIARSTAGSSGGRPMSAKSLPFSTRSVSRPWLRKDRG